MVNSTFGFAAVKDWNHLDESIKYLSIKTFKKQSQVKHFTVLPFMSFQLVFIYLFVYLFIYLFTYLFVIDLFIYYLFIYLFIIYLLISSYFD